MLKIKETYKNISLPDKNRLLSLGYSNLTAEVLLNRYEGKEIEEIKELMRGRISLDEMKIQEVDLASQYLLNIIKNTKKKILILTDYDCDGVSSAVISHRLLRKVIPMERFKVLTNKRKYGNGVNLESIKEVEDFESYDLLITADHGSSNNEVYKELKRRNPKLEIIVTDHHTFREDQYPTEAKYFINNQRYSEKEPEWRILQDLSGCFIMFFFLYKTLKNELSLNDFLMEAFPFLGITAISDVMSMDNEINRALIRIGLRVMNDNRHPLFTTIKWYCVPEKHYSVETIKFMLSPLINTGNRQHCEEVAYKLLISDSPREIVEHLEVLLVKNKERKKFTNDLTSAILNSPKLQGEHGLSITIKTKMGINGIIASKVGEIKQRPMICFVHEDGLFHGSCRSILENIDIIKILERLNQDGLVEKFGGHKMAAGCLVRDENIEIFRKRFDQYVKEESSLHPIKDEIEVFKKLNPQQIKSHQFVNFKHLEPLGKDFESPIFYTEATINQSFSSNSMTFMTFEEISPMIKGVAYHNGRYNHQEVFQKKNTIGMVFTMKLSYFKGLYQSSLNIIHADIIGG